MTRSADDWDAAAATFDDEPDHGLRDPETKAAWTELLLGVLPQAPASVLDLGCGTGTIAVLLAKHGYDVTGIDSSTAMLERARAKAETAGVEITLLQGDAAAPELDRSFDVLICRHVLWALPEPAVVLHRWRNLLAPAGRLVLVEGLWSTGGGTTAATMQPMVEHAIGPAVLTPLTDPALWGKEITDERYLLIARRAS